MSATLHIIHPPDTPDACWGPSTDGTDAALAACGTFLNEFPGPHAVILLGTAAAARRAAWFGIRPRWRIAPALGRPEFAHRALKRAERRLRQEWSVRPRVIAWGRRCARAAALAGLAFERRPPLDGAFARWLPASREDASKIRSELGIPPGAFAALALADPPSSIDVFPFVRALSLIDVGGKQVCAVMPRVGRRTARARRFHRDVGLHMELIETDLPWPIAVRACDAAILCLSERAHPRSDELRAAMLAGAAAARVPVFLSVPNAAPAPGIVIPPRGNEHGGVARALIHHFGFQLGRSARGAAP